MCYINTARAPLDATLTVYDKDTDKVRLKIATGSKDIGSRQAVCVSLGVVTDCEFIDDKKIETRSISVALFAQEARRDFTYWGHRLEFDTISGPMYATQGLKLSTIRRGKGTGITFMLSPVFCNNNLSNDSLREFRLPTYEQEFHDESISETRP